MLNTPPHLEARDPRGFVSIFHGTSSSVARRRLRASDLSFWQSMPSFDIGRPGLHLQSGRLRFLGGRARENSSAEAWEFQPARPVWGATRGREFASLYTVDFNPRAPCGARPLHPHRRGTVIRISIHAPRVGRDDELQRRGAVGCISIHAPRVGRDKQTPVRIPMKYLISIHAPRVGRDQAAWYLLARERYFNPRAPCGARPGKHILLLMTRIFQSTRPVWGATKISALWYALP